MSYEKLLIEAEEDEIEIYENNYIGPLKGLYVDNTITISTNLSTEVEKRCVLAEEIGHHHKSYGDILDQNNIINKKQERLARIWAYKRLIGITKLINAYNEGVRNRYELAEYLNVTEEFVKEALAYYKELYGLYVMIDSYVVYFEPLGILEVW